jgi:predicted Zn-dependent protease
MLTANYFDGHSARLHTIELDLNADTITLAGGGIVKSYPVASAHIGELFDHAPCVIDFPDGARCELHEQSAKTILAQALGYRRSRVERWQQQWMGALLALILLAGAVFSAVTWGVPALAAQLVESMPPSVDRRVGDEALATLESQLFSESHLSDERIAEVEAVFRQALPARPRMPLSLRVVEMSWEPNALALPNGTVVINDAMLVQIMGNPHNFDAAARAQLLGVFAHEIGHIEQRHSMHAIARSSLTAVAAAALLGDFSTVVAGAPVVLLNMNYSRSMELQADDLAIARMHALGLSSNSLAELFEALEMREGDDPRPPNWLVPGSSYLSSHPSNAVRIARFRAGAWRVAEPAQPVSGQ